MGREPDGCAKKKLEDAARYWVGGGSSYQEAIEDLKAFNAPADVIEEVEAKQRGEDFEVWPENWQYVEMFLRLETQWRTTFGGLIGLDYGAAHWLFEVYGVDEPRAMLEAVMVMEKTALAAFSERAD